MVVNEKPALRIRELVSVVKKFDGPDPIIVSPINDITREVRSVYTLKKLDEAIVIPFMIITLQTILPIPFVPDFPHRR
jgi:predicted nucleotide-binding protein (sugar kinase/HSP70/actin superfamily)